MLSYVRVRVNSEAEVVLIVFIKNIAMYDAYSLGFLTKGIVQPLKRGVMGGINR
jgi:hypothetical protein